MALSEDIYTLFVKGFQYSANLETMQEFPHFLHDFLLGASRKEKEPDYLYTDLHVHIKDSENIKDVIEEASKRVDVLAVVTRPINQNRNTTRFNSVIEKLEKEEIEHKRLGDNAVKVYMPNRDLYLLRAIEVYVKENQGIVVVGDDKTFQNDSTLTLEDAIRTCKDIGSFWFLDHPFSIGGIPLISFRYPTDTELLMREKWFDEYSPIIETGNHQNTLWLYPSNVLARRMARKHGLAQITNSDSHHNIKDIGLSRTAIPKSLIDVSSGEKLLSSLIEAYSIDNKDQLKLESGYSSIWSFTKHMIWPHISRKFPIKNNKAGYKE